MIVVETIAVSSSAANTTKPVSVILVGSSSLFKSLVFNDEFESLTTEDNGWTTTVATAAVIVVDIKAAEAVAIAVLEAAAETARSFILFKPLVFEDFGTETDNPSFLVINKLSICSNN